MVGDLVNRGPRSLAVLEWAIELEERMSKRFQMVLGNHEIHLLARAEGLRRALPRDTLDPILESPRCSDHLEWLAARPLVVSRPPYLLVHAGLLPTWSVERAIEIAGMVSRRLKRQRHRLLKGPLPLRLGRGKVSALHKERRQLAVFTRIRAVDRDSEPVAFSGARRDLPRGCRPWFAAGRKRRKGTTVLFGHWAALGLVLEKRAVGLDSGCVWGNALSALRLEDRRLFQQKAHKSEAG